MYVRTFMKILCSPCPPKGNGLCFVLLGRQLAPAQHRNLLSTVAALESTTDVCGLGVQVPPG